MIMMYDFNEVSCHVCSIFPFRFLTKYPDYPKDGKAMDISLDQISKDLSEYNEQDLHVILFLWEPGGPVFELEN